MNIKNIAYTPHYNKSLNSYLKEVRDYTVLDPESEIELFKEYRNGNLKAKDIIVNSNQRFVIAIAKRMSTSANLLDLINEGNIGLIEAIDTFDPTRGFKFISYAVWYIRRNILSYIGNVNSIVRQPYFYNTYKVDKIKDKFINENGYDISDDELINLFGKNKIVKISRSSIDFDDIRHSDNDFNDRYNDEHNKAVVETLLKMLSPRERKIICSLYGIQCEKKSLSDIGKEYNLSSERIRQISAKALVYLRKNMANVKD